MTEKERENKRLSGLNAESKFLKTFLVLLAVFLVFGGPTYFVYLAINVLNLDLAIAALSGFVLLIIGLALVRFLMRRNMIF
jgi:hypothetical protein